MSNVIQPSKNPGNLNDVVATPFSSLMEHQSLGSVSDLFEIREPKTLQYGPGDMALRTVFGRWACSA